MFLEKQHNLYIFSNFGHMLRPHMYTIFTEGLLLGCRVDTLASGGKCVDMISCGPNTIEEELRTDV